MTVAAAPLFEARAVHLWRGDKHLLRGVSFTLRAGELLQIIGPNGVGKSTLLRAVCRLLPMEEGELFWSGESLRQDAPEFASQLAYLAHSNALKADLTAIENLRFELALRRDLSNEQAVGALSLLGIAHCAQLPVRVLSAGQRRRLSLARVLLCEAAMWILDEPTTNLDSAGIQLIEQLMSQHLARGGAILTAAHHKLLPDDARARTLELQS